MSISLPDPDDETLALAREMFAGREAARDLAQNPGEARAALDDILRGTAAGPVPMRLLRLRRHVARAEALARSPAARAAATGTATARDVGPFRLEVAEEAGLVFVVLQIPEGELAPVRIELFGGDGDRHATWPLPDPISGYVQLGMDPGRAGEAEFLELLGDPATEVILR